MSAGVVGRLRVDGDVSPRLNASVRSERRADTHVRTETAAGSQHGQHVHRTPSEPSARVALLGTGNVGKAVLDRLAGWDGTPRGDSLALVHAGNSRGALRGERLCPADIKRRLVDGSPWQPDPALANLSGVADALAGTGPAHRIIIDATASGEVADHHARWLAQGIHVVTACKLGLGTTLERWQDIHDAAAHGSTRYGDSATVGAGLPLLRNIRDLQAGGDTIHAIAGVLSGSLAWLFNHYDGKKPFSELVDEARQAGYTEPDPREDLSGDDVRRKILILARAAGVPLASDEVEVESLLDPAGPETGQDRHGARGEDTGVSPSLDALLQQLHRAAAAKGEQLRYIARLHNGRATVRLETLDATHPLASGAGTDNKLAIWSDRYREQPLVIQGPGAGAEVTAAGLLDDALRIARSTPD
ncbi:homoserine dehydrogenase [Lysobacter ciconiae]|uniref:Homoserine dehydrogenase n=1 Tax=Novilysobacter ciconiae TaxID=2781022 RepID=A0A7S6UF08_9GAMM|nr:homoserine dehydrogenase [Lysobacter ciconiae]QOW19050.1 homoserine dehydrogenase [Lysobacter ciconiae]